MKTGNIFSREIGRQSIGGGIPVFFGALLCLVALAVPRPVRFVVGLPVALVLPGYCVAILIFGKEQWMMRRDDIARLALDVVLSLAVWPILAILVWLTQVRMTATTVVVSLLVLCLVTLVRAHFSARSSSAVLPAVGTAIYPRSSMFPAIAVGLLLLAGAGVTQQVAASLPEQTSAPMSYASLAGPTLAAGGTIERNADGSASMSAAVNNATGSLRSYTVTAVPDGGSPWPTAAVQVRPNVLSPPVVVSGPLPPTGCLTRVKVTVTDDIEQLDPLIVYVKGAPGVTCESQ